MLCPCGSTREYSDCCEIIHHDIKLAKTAEELMRARYCAFTMENIDFIYDTYHHSNRQAQNKRDIASWASRNKWIRLEIIETTSSTVEFKAFYLDENFTPQTHHEKSQFKQANETWFYVDGKYFDE